MLPEKYSADWLERIDKRTRLWRAILPRIQRLEEEAGAAENLTHAKRSLCRRAAFLELLCETQELRFSAGEPLDVGAYTQAFNSLTGAYKTIGCLERGGRRLDLAQVLTGIPQIGTQVQT
jgi:hypothetical protein